MFACGHQAKLMLWWRGCFFVFGFFTTLSLNSHTLLNPLAWFGHGTINKRLLAYGLVFLSEAEQNAGGGGIHIRHCPRHRSARRSRDHGLGLSERIIRATYSL